MKNSSLCQGKYILMFRVIFGLFLLISCGTQVGNPTDNDEPRENTQANSSSPQMGSQSSDPSTGGSQTSSSPEGGQASTVCVVTVDSQPLNPPATIGSVTIVLTSGMGFTASITPPGQSAVSGKTITFTNTGTYKYTVVPIQGSACSGEINVDSNLLQMNVTLSIL